MNQVIHTNKFHTVSIRKYYISKIDPALITMRLLLIEYLSLCTNKYKTEEDILGLTEDLYDLNFTIKPDQIGTYHMITFTANAIDPKYIEDESYTIDKIINAFNDLQEPLILDNSFSELEFNKAKKHLKALIEKGNKYPSKKATRNAFHYYFKGTLRDYNPKGDINILKDITKDDLYNYYLKLKNDEELTISIGDNNFNYSFNNNASVKNDFNFIERAVLKKKRIHTYAKTKQTYLRIIYDTNTFSGDNMLYALSILNYALGGSSYSHLFRIVREKYGLCYSIDSDVFGASGVLVINAEIKKNDLCIVLDKIEECFNTILDVIDLEKIKRQFILSRQSSYDSPNAYISDKLHQIVCPILDDSKTFEYEINRISIDDIKAVKNRINYDAFIYTYGGDLDE